MIIADVLIKFQCRDLKKPIVVLSPALDKHIKGTQMGPLLVLVCPCFMEDVIVTCKIVSFFCSLDNFLLKMWLFSFLEVKFQNGVHLIKGVFLTYFSHFLVTREKTQKILQHISHLHTRILLTLLTFLALPVLEKLRVYHVSWFLFGVTPVVDSLSHLLNQSINNKMVSKI